MSEQRMPTLVPIVCPRCNGLKLDPHLGAGSTDANGANGPLPCEFSLGGCNGAGFLLLPLSPESREARLMELAEALVAGRHNAGEPAWNMSVSRETVDLLAYICAIDATKEANDG